MKPLPYNPIHVNTNGLGSFRFARRYSGNRKNLLPERNGASPQGHYHFHSRFRFLKMGRASTFRITPEQDAKRPSRKKIPVLLSFPPATVMFHFTGYAPSYKGTCRKQVSFLIRKSRDITIVWHLPRAYRSHTTSFIAS
jgi:hypothetical protein